MRVAYVAKHDSGGNDDEGAIAHALQQHGHEVHCLPENVSQVPQCDLLLYHHWNNLPVLRRLKLPKVCWCFDRIQFPEDSSLKVRENQRTAWALRMLEACDLVFHTDGDWVDHVQVTLPQHSTRIHWLMQGADERVIGQGNADSPSFTTAPYFRAEPTLIDRPDILLTGRRRGGTQRESFCDEMAQRWGNQFVQVGQGLHRENLRDAIARTKIVVAPDYPVTHRYWSNRIYNVLGMGGFLLHPFCWDLESHHYTPGYEFVAYQDREDLHRKIEFFLRPENDSLRRSIALKGLEKTVSHHLYRHRLEELLRIVKARLGV